MAKKIEDAKSKFTVYANSNQYQLTAYALGGEVENSARYTGEIWIETKDGKRVCPDISITMTSLLDKKVSFSVKTQALVNAWSEQVPLGGSVSWEFVVLEVYDESKKEVPVHIVYWMGGDWTKLGSPQQVTPQSKKVATFRIERLKFPKGYLENKGKKETGTETLEQGKVSKLIENEPAVEISTGFDADTFVGMNVKAEKWGIVGRDKPVPFDEAVGKEAAGQKAFWVSTPTLEATEIKANFKSNESALPGGLEATSLAQFQGEVRRLLRYLQDNPEVDIEIRAYTDTVGTAEKNGALSQARADSAKKISDRCDGLDRRRRHAQSTGSQPGRHGAGGGPDARR